MAKRKQPEKFPYRLKPAEDNEGRVVRGRHYEQILNEDTGKLEPVEIPAGSVVKMTAARYESLRDKFEPVNVPSDAPPAAVSS